MAHEILMPKLGLTMTEGTVEEWKFKEGDTVKKGDILLSVATDKLTNDVESEVDGVLLNSQDQLCTEALCIYFLFPKEKAHRAKQ